MNERALIYGIAAAASIAAIVTAVSSKVTHPALPKQPVAETVVAETVAPKGDRWSHPESAPEWARVEIDEQPVTVRTVRVVPLFQPTVSAPKFEPVPEPVVAQAPPPLTNAPDNKTRSRRQDVNNDICANHGMKRVEYDGGKRWRCAKK